MKLLEILDRDGVIPALAGRDKRSVLAELAGKAAARSNGAVEADALLQKLLQRENDRSTGIGQGVAVPHGKAQIAKMIAVFGRSNEGVDFGSDDRQPVKLFFALAVPEGQPGCHLAALARIARLLKSDGFRQKLLDATDGDSLYAAIREEDGRV
jgi:mannitol/fructose-specific phosphotransferase system IIA component (Ntr-type)